MKAPRRPGALTIFARTFLLLLAALLIAHASGIALFALRKPPQGSVELSELVALLSSLMPSENRSLHVSDSDRPPEATGPYRPDPHLRDILAGWMGVPRSEVRFFRKHFPPPPEFWKGGRNGPGPVDSGRDEDAFPWPDAAVPPPGAGLPAQWRPDSQLRGEFVSALRLPGGHWRVVESSIAPPGRAAQLGLLLLIGLLTMLPLAWWFARALSAPIRRFAHAADRMGYDDSAPPLPLQGPVEIEQAATAFNAMQARIGRLLRERMQMTGAIAHDLRTPLTRLAFRLESLPPETRDKAARDVEEMSQMIQETLEFLREQSREGAFEALDLRQLVDDLVDGLRDTGRDVVLEESASAPMRGDPLALRRMIGNLIDNALKYGTRVRIRLLDAGDCFELQVDDDGPGIDPDRHDQLFLPFVRGEGSRNRETGGTGLGLASARDVAMSHGGDIVLRNLDDGGLRAIVRLPRGIGERHPPAQASRAAGAPQVQAAGAQ